MLSTCCSTCGRTMIRGRKSCCCCAWQALPPNPGKRHECKKRLLCRGRKPAQVSAQKAQKNAVQGLQQRQDDAPIPEHQSYRCSDLPQMAERIYFVPLKTTPDIFEAHWLQDDAVVIERLTSLGVNRVPKEALAFGLFSQAVD